MKISHKITRLLGTVALSAVLISCTSGPVTSPVPTLKYDSIAPLYINAGTVNIVEEFKPQNDPKDISASFATAPKDTLRSYLEHRIRAAGGPSQLQIYIEEASVHHNVVEQDNKVVKWMKAGIQDEYVVTIRLRLNRDSAASGEVAQANMALQRSQAFAASLSLDEKERAQIQFLDSVMKEVDQAVTTTIRDKLKMQTGVVPSMPPIAPGSGRGRAVDVAPLNNPAPYPLR